MGENPANDGSPQPESGAFLIDQVCARFEAAWKAGNRPRIEDYVLSGPSAKDNPLRRDLLVQLIKIDLEHRCDHAAESYRSLDETTDGEVEQDTPSRSLPERPHITDYLARFPELGSLDDLPEDLIPKEPAPGRGYVSPSGERSREGQEKVEQSPLTTAFDRVHQPSHGRSHHPLQIGRHRVESILGEGGFGTVYLAYDPELQRRVAVKVPNARLLAKSETRESFLAEARILAGLDHPAIVPVYDVGQTDDGMCYVVSKLIDGKDLAATIRDARPAHLQSAQLAATVAKALHHAHTRGLVHRDVKPANILLDAAGEPYVVDFGLTLTETDFGKQQQWAGTPAYMSPEQARGESHLVDGRSDVFSLAVVFYELLTGVRPFRGDNWQELLERIKTQEPRPPRQRDDAIPKELERICLMALAKPVSERYTTALDMAEDLHRAVAMEMATPAPEALSMAEPPAPVLAAPSGAKRWTVARLSALVLVLAAAVSIPLCVWIFAAPGVDPALAAFARAESSLASGEFRLALEDYSQAITRNPTMAAAYAGRGKCRLELNQNEEAVSDFQAAERLGDESARACAEMARGTLSLHQEEFEQAKAHFTRAIELDLDDPRLFSRRGVAKASLGDDQGAIEDLSVAITMDPNPLDYQNRGACHYNLGNYQEAIEDFERVRKLDGSNWRVRLELADCHQESGQYHQAITVLEEVVGILQSVPNSRFNLLKAHYIRGACYADLGDFDQAEHDFSQASHLADPEESSDLELYRRMEDLAAEYAGAERFADAARCATLAVRWAPDGPDKDSLRSRLAEYQEKAR